MSADIEGCARVITPQMWGPSLPMLIGPGTCREIVGSRTGAQLRSLYMIELPAGSSSVPLRHEAEAVYYLVSGSLDVRSGNDDPRSLSEGGMFHVRPSSSYAFRAATDCVLVGGPSPVDPFFGNEQGNVEAEATAPLHEDAVRFFHRDEPGLLVPFISADARLIVWYGVGAVGANMNYVVLQPGERNKEHLHRYSEDTIFILEGHGTAEDVTNGRKLEFGPGDTVTIPPGVVHAVAADRGEVVVSVGGPCPADLDMLQAAGVNVDRLQAGSAEQ